MIRVLAILGLGLFSTVLMAQDPPPPPPQPVAPPPALIPPPMPPKEGINPDHDAMMLIWPEIRERHMRHEEALKKAIESERLIDKIQKLKTKHGDLPEDEFYENHPEEFEEEIHELEGRFGFMGEKLSDCLIQLSQEGVLPELVIQDFENPHWRSWVSFSVGVEREPEELLKVLARSFHFEIKKEEGLYQLSPQKDGLARQNVPRLNVRLEKVPLDLAIKTIARKGRASVVFPENLPSAKVDLTFENVSVHDALKAIAQAYNLRFGREGEVYYFNP